MAISTPHQFPVLLTDEQRGCLEDITRNGHAPAPKIQHARVLLLSDGHRAEGRLTRTEIARLLGMHVNRLPSPDSAFSLLQTALCRSRRRETRGGSIEGKQGSSIG